MTVAPALLPQQPCTAPLLTNAKQGLNIFTDPQEVDLGDAVADQLHQRLRISDNPQMTGYLQKVGERLEKELPPNQLKFRFYLLDIPVANALSLPGGRIYVSPKLIALAQSEDELAGVLAHEMGHIITHQSAITTSELMKAVLGVTQVGNRADIYDKVHRLIANQARGRKTLQKISGQEQQEGADAVAVYVATRAGYSPEAFEAIFGRLVGTKGKAGNWFTDIFGGTPPSAQRLREMTKAIKQLPSGCASLAPAVSAGLFKPWQESVIAFTGWNHEELLHSVLLRTKLDPPLRTEINHLKFSPDGRYVLAQDDSIIYVLSRDPFKILFTIDAPDALPAHFTPDSKSVAFSNSAERVEIWDVATGHRTSAYEVFMAGGCRQNVLSPDGKTLACFTTKATVALLDVASGNVLVEKPFHLLPAWGFFSLFSLDVEDLLPFVPAEVGFSPDSRYFVAATWEFTTVGMGSSNETAAFDLTNRKPISLPGSINRLLSSGFAFLGPDRLIGVNRLDPEKSAVVSFPDGKALDEMYISPAQRPAAVSHGDYAVLRPIRDYPVGLLDLKTHKLVVGCKTPAFDIYDWEYINEARNGELGLYDIKTAQPVTGIALPPGHLAHLSAAAVEPDFKWLAVSSRSRGVVWDLSKGKSVYELRRFNGAYFSDQGELYADFPKYEATERSVVRLDLPGPRMTPQYKVEAKYALQRGRYVVDLQPKDSTRPRFDHDVSYEVHDAATNKLLWSRLFPKGVPELSIEPAAGTIVAYWLASEDGAKEEAKGDAQLENLLRSGEKDKGDILVEVLAAPTGNRMGAMLVKTNRSSFGVKDITASGDWLTLSDRQGEVVIYSLSDGQEKARIFGDLPRISQTAKLLALRTEKEGLDLYDLQTLEQLDEFYFSSPIVIDQFSPDGKRLFVLTADQTAFVLDISTETNPVPSASVAH